MLNILETNKKRFVFCEYLSKLFMRIANKKDK